MLFVRSYANVFCHTYILKVCMNAMENQFQSRNAMDHQFLYNTSPASNWQVKGNCFSGFGFGQANSWADNGWNQIFSTHKKSKPLQFNQACITGGFLVAIATAQIHPTLGQCWFGDTTWCSHHQLTVAWNDNDKDQTPTSAPSKRNGKGRDGEMTWNGTLKCQNV